MSYPVALSFPALCGWFVISTASVIASEIPKRIEIGATPSFKIDDVVEVSEIGWRSPLTRSVQPAEITSISQLTDIKSPELATIRGRVDRLDDKTANLESQQVSTISKLSGSASFLIGGITSSGVKTGGTSRNSNLAFTYSANLYFKTSFTGKDLLGINLNANNAPALPAVTGTPLASFAFDSSTASIPANSLGLTQLFYRFPVEEKATIWIGFGLQPFDYFPVISPLRNGVSVPNSRYGLFNPPIFRPGFTDAGVGAAYQISDRWQLHTGYFASVEQANIPNAGGFGLFNGSSVIAAQLTFKPSDRFASSLNFIHKYFTGLNVLGSTTIGAVNLQGTTGTVFASDPFGNKPTTTDSFGGQFDWRIFSKIGLGGWFSTTAANNLNNSQKATVVNAALSLGFFDLFQDGNHGGILVGIPPYVSSNDNAARKDVNTPWHLEIFYTHWLTKNISITPDLYVILNPDNGTSEPIWAGTLRTTFTF